MQDKGNKPDDIVSATGTQQETRRTRRDFLKSSGLIAASGIAATGALKPSVAEAKASDTAGSLKLPEAFGVAAQTPAESYALPMTGAALFAKACKDEGLAAMFCCPGNYTVTHAMAKIGIPVYTGRDERSMVHAADAFTRVTGEVSATSGTEGPGFTNLVSGLANARAARTPILSLASNKSVKEEDTEAAIQVMEQESVTQHMVKWQKRLTNAHRNHEYAGYAFRQLKTGVPGPVHLNFTAEAADTKLSKPSDITFNFDKNHYRTDAKANPSPAHVAKAIALLGQAKRPIIVSSTGVFYSKAWDALRQFAEKTQIPGRPSAVGHLRAGRAGERRRRHARRPVLHAGRGRVRVRPGCALHPHRSGCRRYRPQPADRNRHRQRRESRAGNAGQGSPGHAPRRMGGRSGRRARQVRG
jgi:hypothetical protein